MAQTLAQDETRRVIAILGGPKVLSRKVKTTADLQSALREGFPYATFERLLTALDLTSKGLAELLGVA